MAHCESLSDVASDIMSDLRISEYTRQFTILECGRGLEYYRSRLRAIRFADNDAVLDAACGIGQWSFALAECNKTVCGIDLEPERIEIARRLCAALNCSNVSFCVGSVEELPYADGSFDAVLCAGAWMFTRPETTLREFLRVLRPGGRLYIQANGVGWSLRSIVVRALLGGDRQATSALGGRLALIKPHIRLIGRTLRAKLRGIMDIGGGVFFTEQYVTNVLKRHGFALADFGGDGEIGRVRYGQGLPTNDKLFYPTTFLGCWCVFELIAIKS